MITQYPSLEPMTFDEAVVLTPYGPGDGLPVFIQPRDARLKTDFEATREWFRANRASVDRLLDRIGAVVLRGFPIADTESFGALIEHYDAPRFGYTGGASSRRKLADRVYESTNIAAEHKIMLHQEMAYLPTFPERIAFYCRVPSVTGGETVMADMRRVTASLPPAFVAEVEKRGMADIRRLRDQNATHGHPYIDLIHLSWQQSFATTDRSRVLEDCEAMGLNGEWLEDGTFSMTYRNDGFRNHPRTGERVWFNMLSVHTLCRQNIGERIELYERHYPKDKPLPSRTAYGDGGPIPEPFVDSYYEAVREHAVAFSWSAGDVLLIDNHLVAHGRNPYSGLRDIQVALLG